MYKEAIMINPANADNYFNLANVHQHMKEFDKAHWNFDAAIQREDRNAKYYHGRGLCFQEQAEDLANNPPESNESNSQDKNKQKVLDLVYRAIEFFQQAVQYCSTFASSMFHLGLMFRRIGAYREALQQFTKV